MIIKDLIREAADELKKVSGKPQLEALIIFEKVSNLKREKIFSKFEERIEPEIINKYKKIINRRISKREPLAYLIGYKEFYSLKFKVNKHVLIPRIETEELVDRSLNFLKSKSSPKILDVGTGSGNIIISIARFYANKNANFFASDISKDAIKVAKFNARRHRVKINFFISNLFDAIKRKPIFDLIVSNPPYVSEDEYLNLSPEVKKEPLKALVSKDRGTFLLKKIIKEAPLYLKKGGILLMEMGEDQKEIIEETHLTFYKDIFKKWRFVSYLKD